MRVFFFVQVIIRMQGLGVGREVGRWWRVWRVDMKEGGGGEVGRGAKNGEGETARG